MKTGAGPQPWEQQPGEPDRDFAAFQVFLGMGAAVSKAGVAHEDGRSRVRILQIWRKWNWDERGKAYREAMKHEPTREVLPESVIPSTISLTSISTNQAMHLERIGEYQVRAEKLGNAQIAIAGQLLQIIQKKLTDYREKRYKSVPADVERLVRAATTAAAGGHKMVGEALGIEELFLTMQEHLESADLATQPKETTT